MITGAAIQAEFETNDGLRVEVVLKVTDEVGVADVALTEILEGIQNYIDSQDHGQDFIDIFFLDEDGL